jgi:murein DD-endopeptidase MepM/ murein hydrolase activator NlpD
MQFQSWIRENQILSFVLGTVSLQLVALSLAFSIGRVAPANAVMVESATEEASAIVLNEPTDLSLGVVENQAEIAELRADDSTFAASAANQNLVPEEPENNRVEGGSLAVFQHEVAAGETLSKIWKLYDAPFQGSVKAHQAFQKAPDGAVSIRAGDTLELYRNDENDIVEVRKSLRGGKTLILRGNAIDGYTSDVISAEISRNDRVVFGSIKRSFSESAAQSNVPYEVVDQLVDLFGSRVEFRKQIQAGDEFGVIYSELNYGADEIEHGPIVAASLKVNGERMVAVRYEGEDGIARYFDENGRSLDRYFLRYPVSYSRISSAFSESRFHPILGRSRPHNGIDFAAPTGTPVRTVADGVVTFAGWNGGSGKMVRIQHGERYATAYLHLSQISGDVRVGRMIQRGTVLGAVGSTGLATGPHLHFSFFDNGRYVDPLKVNLPTQAIRKADMISPRYLRAALRTLDSYHSMQSVLASLDSGWLDQPPV